MPAALHIQLRLKSRVYCLGVASYRAGQSSHTFLGVAFAVLRLPHVGPFAGADVYWASNEVASAQSWTVGPVFKQSMDSAAQTIITRLTPVEL